MNSVVAPTDTDGNNHPVVAPVTVTLNLMSGGYHDVVVSLQPGVTLVVNGLDGNATFVGGLPAFILNSGTVIIRNARFQNATDAPTILVTGGSLTLRNDIVRENTGFSRTAVAVTGGTVDLGTTADPGCNILNANGPVLLISNTGTGSVSAVGTTFEQSAVVLMSPFRIQDLIVSSVTSGSGGAVTFGAADAA